MTAKTLLTALTASLLLLVAGCSSPFTLSGFLNTAPAGGESPQDPPPPQGTVIREESFESATPGTIANNIGFNSTPVTNASATVAYWFGSNVLALSDTNPTGRVYAHDMVLPYIATRGTIEYDVAQTSGRLWSHLELRPSNSFFTPIVVLFIDDNGDIYYTDPLGTDHLMAYLPPDVFYTIRLEVDLIAQTFDLYFADVLIQADLAFSNPGDDIACVEFRTGDAADSGLLLMDNLRIISHD
jgi:hypothetical protein